ncbi:TPA: DUF550 domain-containing protein [Escherichia coli]|nr:DUF550 domain-containing protein [Escherichia coli]
MSAITKERIKLFIKNPLDNGLTRGEQMEVARIALASLEAEPIAWECGENIILFNPDTVEAYAKRAEITPKPLFAAPPTPVVPEEMYWQDAPVEGSSKAAAYATGWNACRAAMLHGTEPVRQTYKLNELSGNYPVTPDGWVMVPKRLTAENGAKGALSGEFSETTFISCPECFGDDDCDTCDGSGRIEIKVPVTWTTIKSIWDKGIAYFAAEPPQEVNRG